MPDPAPLLACSLCQHRRLELLQCYLGVRHLRRRSEPRPVLLHRALSERAVSTVDPNCTVEFWCTRTVKTHRLAASVTVASLVRWIPQHLECGDKSERFLVSGASELHSEMLSWVIVSSCHSGKLFYSSIQVLKVGLTSRTAKQSQGHLSL